MSQNPLPVHIFTDASLREHELKIATRAAQVATIYTARQMIRMTPAQQMQAMTNNCNSLLLPADKLNTILDHLR